MYKFFVDASAVGADCIYVTGSDVNHISNVLRMKIGEQVYASVGDDREYLCSIESMEPEQVTLKILDVYGSNRELSAEIILFQSLVKGDKMETIIQKAVELGVTQIVPVISKRVIVKLDEKKSPKKLQRWNSIAEAAAKQSKRNVIPVVSEPITFQNAMDKAITLERVIIPYENAEGMDAARKLIGEVSKAKSIGIFIGPEGGFAEEEIQLAIEHHIEPMTLGHRILRAETAGMTILSILMFQIEQD